MDLTEVADYFIYGLLGLGALALIVWLTYLLIAKAVEKGNKEVLTELKKLNQK